MQCLSSAYPLFVVLETTLRMTAAEARRVHDQGPDLLRAALCGLEVDSGDQ